MHPHGSSRYWEQWVHPAPPVLSKRSTHALHSVADRSDEVLQLEPVQPGLVVPLHWLDAAAAALIAEEDEEDAAARVVGPVFESIGDGTSPSDEKELAASCGKGGRERIWPPKSGVFLKDYKESEW